MSTDKKFKSKVALSLHRNGWNFQQNKYKNTLNCRDITRTVDKCVSVGLLFLILLSTSVADSKEPTELSEHHSKGMPLKAPRTKWTSFPSLCSYRNVRGAHAVKIPLPSKCISLSLQTGWLSWGLKDRGKYCKTLLAFGSLCDMPGPEGSQNCLFSPANFQETMQCTKQLES